MNARLYGTIGREGSSGDAAEEDNGIVFGDGRQPDRCIDSRDWIGKASGYADFDERDATARHDVSSKAPLPSYGPAAIGSDAITSSPSTNVAAPSFDVTSRTRDNARPRVHDIETTYCSAIRASYPLDAASCNAARNAAPAPCNIAALGPCNVAAAGADCDTADATTLFRNATDDGQLVDVPQSVETRATNASITKHCQLLGQVDVEDLAMYFDLPSTADSAKPPSTGGRAIYSRRTRYGQVAATTTRVDQSRQDRRDRVDVTAETCGDAASYNLRPCYSGVGDPGLAGAPQPFVPTGAPQSGDLGGSDDPRYGHSGFVNVRHHHHLEDTGIGDPASTRRPEYDDLSGFGEARFYDPRMCAWRYDDTRFCGLRPCELARNVDPGRNNQGQSEPRPGDWLCDSCPEPFNFCSEERWLQCPASDRCPLYDASYIYGAPVLPPCMYDESLHAATFYGNDNGRYYDYAEDEQLLEDYLSNEKRKERSRDAARCRRSRETDIFAELAAALPVVPEQAAHLDKASVMRLAIAYLKMRAVVDSIPASAAKSESSVEMDELFAKALNGFILVLSSDGNMVYLSENVSDYLGVSQMDMMGQSVYEYSHPCDHDELRECLSSKLSKNSKKRVCNFFLRLKCTLTSKGRKVNLKSATYKVIHCTGRLTNIRDSNSNSMDVDNEEEQEEEEEKEDEPREHETGTSLVLVGCPIPHPSNIEIPLGRHTFLSKHSLNMKFTYADEKLAEYLGWSSEELMGRSVFEFYHALDNLALDKCFKCLFSKGQCETVAYRFLGKKGGYAWVVTQATLIHCSKQQKPVSVVCVNYVLSGVEREDEVYSERQLAVRDSVDPVKSDRALPPLVPIGGPAVDSTQIVLDEEEEVVANAGPAAKPIVVRDEPKSDDYPRPLAVTASVFRSAEENEREDGTRQDNALPTPGQESEKAFVGVRALKESLEESIKESIEESLKENNEPVTKKRQNCRSSFAKAPFVFQGKPAVERDSTSNPARRGRPQTVTRHLFAPLATIVQQQQQQQQQQQEQPQPQPQPQLSCRPPPQTATASIFAPRTEDMNKGFLTFSEDQPGLTMLKDEPEDLTHLAPTPGDVCVPLEDTPFLSDMLDEFFLSSNYGPLLSPGSALPPELRSAADLGESLKDTDLVDATRTKDAVDRLADSDPFMYGDSPGSPCGIDPSAVSSSLSKYRQSPERSVDSLDSPTGGSGGDGLSEDEMLMLGINDNIGDDELALRAPYIPMSDQDETLELLISDDMVMWSPSQSSDKGSSLKWLIDDREHRGSESSLAQLLRTDQVASRRYNDHGGGLVNPSVFGQIPRKTAAFESERWSSDQERNDRPNKRIHAPCTDPEGKHKRLKCEDSPFERGVVLAAHPEDIALMQQQQQQLLQQRPSTPSRRKSSNLGSTCGSQLLRRLVSQTPGVTSRAYNGSASSSNRIDGERRRDASERDTGMLGITDFTDGDSGGGGGGGGRRSCDNNGDGDGNGNGSRNGNGLNKIDASRRNPSCGVGSSVLMNLLVSGCDNALMDSRDVPTLLSRNLITAPLSVHVDSQMVPQCANADNVTCLDHLSPDTRGHLIGSFTGGGGGGGGGGSAMVSPTTSAMSFDSFDYDVGGSTASLLQVGSDLLGGLLDRNLA